MKLSKTIVAASLALTFASAYAFVEVPVVVNPSDPPSPRVVPPKLDVAKDGDITLGHGSAGIAIDPVAGKAFITNYASGTLSVVDLQTLRRDEL